MSAALVSLKTQLLLVTPVTIDPIEAKIEQIFPDNYGTMKLISMCESGMRQFDTKGNVIVSPTADYGVMQINKRWIPTAKEFGLDIDTVEGNIWMARYIYNVQGLDAWTCWKKINS